MRKNVFAYEYYFCFYFTKSKVRDFCVAENLA